jgi:hypothetical protein
MPSRRAEFSRRSVRWLGPAALLALTPKCLLCVLAYAGLGAAIGLRGPEICGAPSGAPGSWALALAGGGAVGIAGWLMRRSEGARGGGRGNRS